MSGPRTRVLPLRDGSTCTSHSSFRMPSPTAAAEMAAMLARPYPIVLVTGGAGYIGSHAVLEILKTGCAVVVVDSLVNSHMQTLVRVYHVATREYIRLGRDVRSVPPLFFHRINLCDPERLAQVFRFWQTSDPALDIFEKEPNVFNIGTLAEGVAYKMRNYDLSTAKQPRPINPVDTAMARRGRIIAVIHFAALKAVGESVSNLLQHYQNNITGLLNLLDCMTTYKVNRLVCSSTAVAHSFGKDVVKGRESVSLGGTNLHELLVTNPYCRSKQLAEEILYDCCLKNPELEVVALRYPNVTGAHPSGLINEDPKRPSSPVVADFPEFIHVEDAAAGHVAALRAILNPHFSPNHRIYSLGTGQGYWGLDVIKAFASSAECDILFPNEETDGSHLASTAKPITGVSWEADFDLQDICLDTYLFSTENPDGYERLRKLSGLATKYAKALGCVGEAVGVWTQSSPHQTAQKSAFLKYVLRRLMSLCGNQKKFDTLCTQLCAAGECFNYRKNYIDPKPACSEDSQDRRGRQKGEFSILGDDWQEVSLPIRSS